MNRGFAVIVNVIALGLLMMVIGIALTVSTVNEGQNTLVETRNQKNQAVLEACTEEALLRINEQNNLPSNIYTTLGSCTVTINSQVGTSWVLSIGTTGEFPPVGVRVVLDRGSSLAVSAWSDQ